MKRIFLRAILLLMAMFPLLYIVDIHQVRACTITPITMNAPKNFTIKVINKEKGVSGISVRILDEKKRYGHVLLKGETDKLGDFEVSGLPVGVYGIYVGENSEFQSYSIVETHEKSPYRLNNVVKIHWPQGYMTQTIYFNEVAGVIRILAFAEENEDWNVGPPVENVRISILNPKSGNNLFTSWTDDRGHFKIESLPEGLYAMEVSFAQIKGELRKDYSGGGANSFPIEVLPKSRTAPKLLEMAMFNSGCGWMVRSKVLE